MISIRGCELVEVHAEARLLAERDGLRDGADEVHLRRVGGVARVGQDHLVAGLDAGEEGEEEDVLRPRHQHHVGRVDLGGEHPADELRDSLAGFEDPAGRGVVRIAVLHGADRGLDDVVGRGEVRLADLEVDDPLALGLELARPRQHLERSLGAETRHPLGKTNRGAGHRSNRT